MVFHDMSLSCPIQKHCIFETLLASSHGTYSGLCVNFVQRLKYRPIEVGSVGICIWECALHSPKSFSHHAGSCFVV